MRKLFHICSMTLATVAVFLAVSTADATTLIAMDDAQLVKTADLIVVGNVKDSEAQWTNFAAARVICTYTTVEIVESVKVPAGDTTQPGKEIVVRTLGGVVGPVGCMVEGMPRLKKGEQKILFLKARTKEGTQTLSNRTAQSAQVFSVIGAVQGVKAVAVDAATGERMVRPVGIKQSGGAEALSVPDKQASSKSITATKNGYVPLNEYITTLKTLVAQDKEK